MFGKRFIALVMALTMLFTLMAPVFTFAVGEGDPDPDQTTHSETGEQPPATDPNDDDGEGGEGDADKGGDQGNGDANVGDGETLSPATVPGDGDGDQGTKDGNEQPTRGDKTITVGVISYLYDEVATGWQVRFWGGADEANDADCTSTGHIKTYHLGNEYWSNKPQTFYIFSATIPADATGFKPHNGDRWFGDNVNASEHDAVFVFNYDGDKAWPGTPPEHVLIAHAAVPATCTEPGNSAYWECTECGRYFSDAEGANPIDENSWVIAALGHDYVAVVTPPTCGAQGYTTHTCSRCGDEYIDTYVDATGDHVWGEPVWGVPQDGGPSWKVIVTRTCSTCSTTETKPSYVDNADVATVAATCAAGGYKKATFEAEFDGQHIEKEITWAETEIDASSHAVELVEHKALKATCTEAGNNAYWYCSACGKYFSDEGGTARIDENSWITPATGIHTYENGVCTVCGAVDPAAAVAKIGDEYFATLQAAVDAANTGDVVEILAAGTYTLPNLPKNITLEGKVDGVVFNHTSAGSIASIPNGATIKNVTFNFGNVNYHGFQHAGVINMIGCTLNGKLFSYGDMNFTDCAFKQTTNGDYHMWCYSGDITYDGCTFTNTVTGKFLNIYNESGATKYTVTVKNCTFTNTGSKSKAALNVKETSGSNLLTYDVIITSSTAVGDFPSASESAGLIVGEGGLWQVDDRQSGAEPKVAVFLDGVQVYPVYVASVFDGTETKNYTSLQAALDAAHELTGEVTVTMLADDTVAVEGYALTINAGKNIVLDLNGHEVIGQCTSSETSALIRNLGILTIKDSGGNGKIEYKPTNCWVYSEANPGGYVSNLIRNEGTLIVNGGKLFNEGDGSAAYAIDNYGSGKVTINGGTLDTGLAYSIRMFYCNGGSVTVNDGVISQGLQVMSGDNADLIINGGVFNDLVNAYGEGDSTVVIKGGTFKDAVIVYYSPVTVTGGEFKGTNSTYGSAYFVYTDSVNISEADETKPVFASTVSFFASHPESAQIAICGGEFSGDIEDWSTIRGYISGGIFGAEPDPEDIVPGKCAIQRADKWWEIGEAVAEIGAIGYATLEAAVAAAVDGDTVKLLKDAAGNGIKAPQGKFTNGLTVDFDGHTYDFSGKGVGSTGTEYNGFQLLKDNTITFKDGTIKATSGDAGFLIQNYSNLTLDGMTIDGTGVWGGYVMSNNNGNIVIKDTTITAKDGDYAFDVCRYASYPEVHVTVTGTSEINGDIEVSASGNNAMNGFSLMLEGGTFSGKIVLDASVEDLLAANTDNVWVKKIEGVEIEIPDGYAWKLIDAQNGIYLLTKAVAKIERDGKTLYFATLNDAVAAVQNGETIIMIADVNNATGIAVASGSNFTVDFDGHTYLVAGPGAGSTGTQTQAFQLLKDSTITFENGILGYAEGNTTVKRMFQNYANLTLDNMTINAAGQAGGEAYVLSFNNGRSVLTNGTKIITTSNDTAAFDVYDWPSGSYTDGAHLKIVDAEINGKIVFDNSDQNRETGSTLEITGGKVGEVTHDGTLYDGQIVITGGVFRVAPLFAYCGKDAEGNQLYPIPNTDPETKEAYPYTVGIAVAKIGDVYYTTLEAAFADAIDGDTIVVLRDSAGNGIKVPQGKFNTNGLTIDFGGFKYTMDGAMVGSTGTETQAFQLLMDNNITFKNGTISSEKAKILVQNYSSLTLENMTLDGSKLVGSAPYTLSNNNGTIVIDGSKIIAKDGGFAFDVCRYASYKSVNVTVKGDSVINGNIEVYASNKDAKDGFSLMLEGGTFNGKIVLDASVEDLLTNPPEKAWVKRDKTKVEIEIPAGYTWVDLEGNIQLLVKLMTVTFDADNGTEKVTVEVPKGQKVERPSDPVKDHYNFLGWFEEGAENAFDFKTAITENVELKARWQGDAVMIIYTDYFDGKILQRFNVHYGDPKEAYTFTATDQITDRDGYHYNVNDMWTIPVAETATEDIVYVLKWIKGIAVTFDPDNGEEATVVTVDRDTAVEKPATDPEKEGYTFAGWFVGNNAYDFTALVTGSLYLKAKWTPNKMTVTFDTDGGSAIEAVKVDYDTAVEMPAAPTKDGFVFSGWTLNDEAYDFSKPVTSNIMLTAQWVDAVAKIGDVMYLTLRDAVDAVQNGETIVLLKDTVTVDAENGLTYTIAMNGHTLTGITWVTDDTTLTLDGSVEGSAYNGSIYVGYATNNNGNVTLDGGTYACGAGNTVLHINGTCLNSNVTIRNAKITSPDDNGIQLNGSGEFVIENSEISGATGIYVKSGHLTITNSTITGNMNPANYTYNGNGAVATGDAIVVDSCEYPGGAPVVEIGDGNAFNGTKKQVGYYEFDANRDGETQEGRVTAKTNELTIPEGYAWLKLAKNEYLLVKAVAQVEDGYFATFEEAFAVDGVVRGSKIIKLLADGAEYEFHAGDVLKVQKANNEITFVYTSEEGVIVKVSEPEENGTVTYTTAEAVAKIGNTFYATVKEAIEAVNAGEAIEVLKDVAEDQKIGGGKSFTLDLGGHTLTGSIDQYDADVTIKNGTLAGTIYANGLADGQSGKLTIEADATVEADYAVILWQANDNAGNGYTIDINGTVNGIVWVMGNITEGNSVINVNDGATVTGDDVGIALNGAAIVNVKEGATVTGTGTGIEVRAGILNVAGGTITGSGAATEVKPNGSGTTTSGAGIAIAQHTTGLDVSVNVSGGTITGTTALNIANPQGNSDGAITVAVTGGIFNGPVNVDETETRVEKFVSGGDFIETVKPDYVVDGKLCTTTLTEPINGADYYYIVDAVTVTFDANEGQFPAAEGEEPKTIIEVVVPAGEKVTAVETPIREPHIFDGWFEENAEAAFDFENTTVTENLTLKAKWHVDMYLVTVTSSGNGQPIEGATVANVTGGGSYALGAKITVSAPTVSGYTFLGWYVLNGDKLSEQQVYEYTVLAEGNNLIAVYTPVGGATFRLTVTGSKFTVSGFNATQRSYFDRKITANETITVTFTGTEKFLYWINGSNKIVSRSPAYTFMLVQDTDLTAVYSEADTAEALIVFVSAKENGQVMSSFYATASDPIEFPLVPSKMGQAFKYWSIDGATEATEDVINNAIASAQDGRIEVYPLYESTGGTYDVTVVCVDANGTEISRETPFVGVTVGSSRNVTAEATLSGKEFSYWADEAGNILAYTLTYTVRPVKNITLYAVYGAETAARPTVVMSQAFATIFGTKYRVSFTATRSVPEGYTVQRAGMIYVRGEYLDTTSDESIMQALILDSDNGNVKIYTTSSTTSNDTFTLNINTSDMNRVFYARGYVIVNGPNGVETIYADTYLFGSYDTLKDN